MGDYVLVKPKSIGEEKSKGGIYIFDTAKRGAILFGTVILVGAGIFTQNGARIPMTVRIGNEVMYKHDMAGDAIKIDGEDYYLFHEGDLLMVQE